MKDLSGYMQALLNLIRSGLWGKEARLAGYNNLDFNTICALAEEQGLIGLVTAGVEQVDEKHPKNAVLKIVGRTLQLELRNKEMNLYLAETVGRCEN